MKTIKLKELSEQLNIVKSKDVITWEDIDPIRSTLESKCFKINNRWEACFMVWLIEHLFDYRFYKSRYRDEEISNAVNWWYMCFWEKSWWWSPSDYAENIFRSMKIDSCYEEDINERYEEVSVRELEIYRWNDVKLLINKMLSDWLI